MSKAEQFFEYGKRRINLAKKVVLDSMSAEAVARINSISGGQLAPNLRKEENGFVVSIPFSTTDPSGIQTREIERQTKAFKSTAQILSDKQTVVELVNKSQVE